MAINRVNKFDTIVDTLDHQEDEERKRTDSVVKTIVGSNGNSQTKVITDKNGRQRTVKVVEKRKTLCVYIPERLYEQFDAITTLYGKSNNSTIVELIRDYVIEKKSVLDEV